MYVTHDTYFHLCLFVLLKFIFVSGTSFTKVPGNSVAPLFHSLFYITLSQNLLYKNLLKKFRLRWTIQCRIPLLTYVYRLLLSFLQWLCLSVITNGKTRQQSYRPIHFEHRRPDTWCLLSFWTLNVYFRNRGWVTYPRENWFPQGIFGILLKGRYYPSLQPMSSNIVGEYLKSVLTGLNYNFIYNILVNLPKVHCYSMV